MYSSSAEAVPESHAELWLPVRPVPDDASGMLGNLSVVARLARWATIQQARSELFMIENLPGVRAVGSINSLPVAGILRGAPFDIVRRPDPRPDGQRGSMFYIVGGSGRAGARHRGSDDRDRPEPPVADIRTMHDAVSIGVAQPRFTTLFLGSFAAAALLLAAIGLYAVIAFTVEQRMQEIGLRVALGAERRDVLRLVMRQGLVFTGTGLAFGLAAVLAVTVRSLFRLHDSGSHNIWHVQLVPRHAVE